MLLRDLGRARTPAAALAFLHDAVVAVIDLERITAGRHHIEHAIKLLARQ
jgi:hypothetical protein